MLIKVAKYAKSNSTTAPAGQSRRTKSSLYKYSVLPWQMIHTIFHVEESFQKEKKKTKKTKKTKKQPLLGSQVKHSGRRRREEVSPTLKTQSKWSEGLET
jgi:hypothetical protein